MWKIFLEDGEVINLKATPKKNIPIN